MNSANTNSVQEEQTDVKTELKASETQTTEAAKEEILETENVSCCGSCS